ncbi:tetratricopeptide repeat protein [Devosia sp. BK]|uniref:methyltransferase domain-containing protein n=1 Tax=Devosia sp. BK TaxID=2871706 RepID=UPI00293A6175|nr:methyltransferase domain-containing protein [Devosia sp. BK]MDV3250296.1 tetratricopeptide repeat protein [Devosia sp. BK]
MKKPTGTLKGLPSNPILALRATELLATGEELERQGKIADAARLSAELVNVAPDLPQGHKLMGSLAMRTGAAEIAAVSFRRALALQPRSAELHIALAQALLALKQPQDALDLLNKGRTLHPNDGCIFRELAQAQLDLGQSDAALKSFSRAVKLQPKDLYSAHMVAALSKEGAPDKTYVAELFDSYAETFDEHLTDKLEYRVPQAIADLLATNNVQTGPTLDLGCGTGLMGAALPQSSHPIDGIDIAPKMVAKAEARGLYRHLVVGDAATVLATNEDLAGPYALVVATDVFIYIGDIEPLFQALLPRLAPGAHIAFSIETHDGDGIAVRSSGRFAHGAAYIRDLAARHGLTIVAERDQPIRLEREVPIPGAIFLLQRA